MDYFLIITISLLLILLALASPYVGLLIYLSFLYLRPSDLYPALAPYHVARIMAIVVLISFFIRYNPTLKSKHKTPPQTKMFIGWMLLILLSTIPGWWRYSLNIFYDLAKIFIAYFLIINLVNSESRLRGIVWALLSLNAILAWNSVQVYFESLGNMRIGGFTGAYFGNAGDFAVMINFMIPIAFMLVWAEKKIVHKLLALFCLVLLIGSIVATQARGAGVITLAVVFLTLVIFGLQAPRRSLKIGSVVLCIFLIGVIVAIGSPSFWARASTSTNPKKYTAIIRTHLMVVGIKMFLKHPILGVGAHMYPDRYPEFSDWDLGGTRVHNMYVTMAAELGIGGITLFLLLLYYSLKDNWIAYRRSLQQYHSWTSPVALGLLISVIAFAVGGMFQTVLYYPPPYLIIGIAVALKRLLEREEALAQTQRR